MFGLSFRPAPRRYESGLPTYDGRFSSFSNDHEFAVSGVDCNEEDFMGDDKNGAIQTCVFRTICGKKNPRCVVQQSMKQWKGHGYACTKKDKAGVACGTREVINQKLRDNLETKCDRY